MSSEEDNSNKNSLVGSVKLTFAKSIMNHLETDSLKMDSHLKVLIRNYSFQLFKVSCFEKVNKILHRSIIIAIAESHNAYIK